LKQNAVVTHIINERMAEVTVERQSACGHDCASCEGGCANPGILKVTAKNPIGARDGDRVEIESSSRKILLIAAAVYLLPLFLLLLFYFLAQAFGAEALYAGLSGAAGFILGVLAGIALNHRAKKTNAVSFEIIRIIN